MPMRSSSSMKVHPFGHRFWDHNRQQNEPPASLTLGCKRLRSRAPKLANNNNGFSFDVKSFIKLESSPKKVVSSSVEEKRDYAAIHQQVGGTRWNPTEEQIGILEMLYAQGMRTPKAQEIEEITEKLGKYGKIEGKNVFYWFQNHKARQRQKQKRTSLGLVHSPRTPPQSSFTTSISLTLNPMMETNNGQEISPYKRKFESWNVEVEEDNKSKNKDDKTLELFPLHPESRSMKGAQIM